MREIERANKELYQRLEAMVAQFSTEEESVLFYVASIFIEMVRTLTLCMFGGLPLTLCRLPSLWCTIDIARTLTGQPSCTSRCSKVCVATERFLFAHPLSRTRFCGGR